MALPLLIGHTDLRARLGGAFARGSLPGSLLFHGLRGVGKQRLALWLGQRILCQGAAPQPCGTCQQCRFALRAAHPDLHWFFPRPRLKDSDPSPDAVRADYSDAIAERVETNGLYAPPGGEEGIYVATVRAIVQMAALKPALAPRKVFVVGDAERMVSQEGADQAANAFLKLLEEPPANTTIILTSSEPGALLPTIRSRVAAVRVPPLSNQQVLEFIRLEPVRAYLNREAPGTAEPVLVELARGQPGRLFELAARRDALERGRRILDAALRGDRAERMQVAFSQSSAKARGSFADTLDAVTSLLRDRTHAAVARSDEAGALAAACAVASVEQAKDGVDRNANPQLITAMLMRELESALG